MRTFVYPGSFDPPTLGHEDVAVRASKLCDCLIVAVLDNAKKHLHFFSIESRVEMLESLFSDRPKIKVVQSHGLLVDLCREYGADAVVRGLRGHADIEDEMCMASVNNTIGDVETIFLASRDRYRNISSSVVRELISYNCNVSAFVPETVLRYMNKK